ncbi:MAG: phosphotransferase [Parvibaculaceae bacterium]|nr:phosphotransferase [Parvibaculaceae bacterium]
MSDNEIEALIRPRFGSDALEQTTLLSGGRINSNYALSLKVEPFNAVLRLHARGQSTCRMERDILRNLEGQIPVAKVLHDGSDTTHPFLVLSWINGETLDHTLDQQCRNPAKLGSQVGEVLANIHQIEFPETGFFGHDLKVEKPFPSGKESFLSFVGPALEARAGKRLGPDRTEHLQEFSQWAAPLLDQLPKRACLVHSDFNPPNMMIHHGELAAVLDWEFAHAGTPLTDIANMLRPRAYQPTGFDDAFIAAYETAAGPLPPHWQSLSRILDLMAQIEMLDAPEERPSIFKWAIERVDDTIRFVESSFT